MIIKNVSTSMPQSFETRRNATCVGAVLAFLFVKWVPAIDRKQYNAQYIDNEQFAGMFTVNVSHYTDEKHNVS